MLSSAFAGSVSAIQKANGIILSPIEKSQYSNKTAIKLRKYLKYLLIYPAMLLPFYNAVFRFTSHKFT